MRVIRLLVYDGDDEAMAKQLGNSLNDGIKVLKDITISVFTIDIPKWLINIFDDGGTFNE